MSNNFQNTDFSKKKKKNQFFFKKKKKINENIH